MRELFIQLITAFTGSLGFCLLFGLRTRYLAFASLGGMLAWGIYLAVDAWLQNSFLACLLGAAFAVLYAELLARRLKTPTTLFVIPAILPLVPGSFLYYTMSSAVRGELELARSYGRETALSALAIAAGLSFVIAARELRTKR